MPEVWRIDVAAELRRLPAHRARLTDVERERATRFRRDADRERFVIGRSTRRELLAMHLGIDPAALIFDESRYGKPRLPAGRDPHPHFNSSHSGRWVLHAIADVEVGIDVEEIRPEFTSLDDFAWMLSEAERAFVQAAAPPQRAAALTTIWVRKEAYVKALGEGLSRSLPQIGITAGADGRPMLAFDRNPPARERRWSFADLEIDATHKACLVHAGPACCFDIRNYRSG
jgi:4'-phosphopantetheinyl transferase